MLWSNIIKHLQYRGICTRCYHEATVFRLASWNRSEPFGWFLHCTCMYHPQKYLHDLGHLLQKLSSISIHLIQFVVNGWFMVYTGQFMVNGWLIDPQLISHFWYEIKPPGMISGHVLRQLLKSCGSCLRTWTQSSKMSWSCTWLSNTRRLTLRPCRAFERWWCQWIGQASVPRRSVLNSGWLLLVVAYILSERGQFWWGFYTTLWLFDVVCPCIYIYTYS